MEFFDLSEAGQAKKYVLTRTTSEGVNFVICYLLIPLIDDYSEIWTQILTL